MAYISTTIPEGDEPISRMIVGYRKGIGTIMSIGYQKLVFNDKFSIGASMGSALYLNQIHKEYQNGKVLDYRAPGIRLDFAIMAGVFF